MAAKDKAPEIIQLSTADLEQLLAEVRPLLPPASYGLIESLLRTLVWIMGLLDQKQTTIARLRRLIFGEKTEKMRKLFPEAFQATAGSAEPKSKRQGHGRKGAKDYRGARRVKVPHPKLHLGDFCPKCLKGKLYLFSHPAQIIRVVAQPIFQATIFELERLRCALCGVLFTAPAPPEAGQDKHDPSVGNMLAVLRYGMGQPMYRTDKWQGHFGVPLPASTQWKLIAAHRYFHHRPDLSGWPTPHRPVLHWPEARRENLDRTLKGRMAGLGKPIHMGDGLLRNISKEFETILCNCLCHGRRQVVDVAEKFPEQSRKIIEVLAEVYRVDAQAKEQQLSDAARLLLHQTSSRPSTQAERADSVTLADESRKSGATQRHGRDTVLFIPALANIASNSQNLRCLQNTQQLMIALSLYSTDQLGYLPPNPDDGTLQSGKSWLVGAAGIGEAQEFDYDILADPKRSLLAPYLVGDVTVYHCPSDPRRGKQQGTNAAVIGVSVPAARSYSMNGAIGTNPYLPGGKSPTDGPWLDGAHSHKANQTWFTFAKISEFIRCCTGGGCPALCNLG